ncbi:EAL and HDOD domain-containing protein [Tissierella carlieri]|uniref:EAL and HDOD domain-containing protein n=1 Tax=Tissierella carlieri TaxID=689904 RepID=UPI00386ECDC1
MDVFLARQPIFDSEQKVSAYEILYRSGLVNNFDGIDGDEASREVIFNTFQTFGIENLTNAKPVFINFTESLINDETATLFSKDLLVVEILEDVLPSEQVIENSKSLKEMGYKIALDDFIYKPEYEELIELADIVKIDFLLSDKEEIKRLSRDLKKRNIELLAEKVETREDFEYAKKLGFSLFQGFFFSKPEIVISKRYSQLKLLACNWLAK